MRYMETMKAANLTNAIYVWDSGHTDGHYHLILERETYEANVVSVDSSAVSITKDAYATTTYEFILPRVFSNILILDGVSWGNIRIFTEEITNSCPGSVDIYHYIHAHISILARTTAGVDRTLATFDTPELVKFWDDAGNSTQNYTEEFPLRIVFDNQKLLASERLIMKLELHGKYTINDDAYTTHSAKLYHTINTNQLYMQIPIAGEQ